MSDASDLVEWLRAQFDEDEGVAGAAVGVVYRNYTALADQWTWRGGGGSGVPFDLKEALNVGEWMEPVVQHIARWDPARALAEVETKRRLVDLHGHADGYCQNCHADRGYNPEGTSFCSTLRLLALPYANRPGYDETWRP